MLTNNLVRKLKEELLNIDRGYGYEWLPFKPLTSGGCLQIYYSVYLACDAYLRPCADIEIEMFDVRKCTVRDALKSNFFRLMHNIENQLLGKCGSCPWSYECIGCRGAAFSGNINFVGDPFKAVLCEDPFCWHRTMYDHEGSADKGNPVTTTLVERFIHQCRRHFHCAWKRCNSSSQVLARFGEWLGTPNHIEFYR